MDCGVALEVGESRFEAAGFLDRMDWWRGRCCRGLWGCVVVEGCVVVDVHEGVDHDFDASGCD